MELTRIQTGDATAKAAEDFLSLLDREGKLKPPPPPPPPKGGGAGDGDGEEGEPFGKFPEADAKLLAIYDQIRKAGTLAQEDLIAISEKASALRLEQLAAELDAVKKVTAEERQIILAAEEDRLQRESEDLAVAPIKQRLQAESQAYEQILQLDTLTAAQREDIWGKLADSLVAQAEMAANEIGRHSEEAADNFRSFIPDMVGAARESYITDRLRSDLQEFDSILSQMLTANNLAADQMAAVWDQREAFAGRKIDLETEAFARLARSVGLVESAVIDLTYAYREYAEAALEASRDAARMGQLEAAAGPLQSMLESDSLTQDEQFVVRGAVKQIGAERIDLEVKGLANLLRALGMEEEQVGKLTAAYERLEGEELDALGKAAKGMWDLADVTRDAVESMHDALTNGFLRALEGEFVKFRDFVRAVAQDIARSFAEKYMDKFVEWGMDQLWEGAKGLLGGDSEADTQAQINAEKVKGIALTGVETAAIVAQTGAVTGLAGAFMMLAAAKSAASMGGGDAGAFTNWLFSGDAVAFAEGGLVDRPTLALIGEAGPEVVVPVAEMENARFWKRLGLDMPTDRSLTENIDRWLQPEVGKALIDDLPAYGSGGIVTSPQVALIGEAGPEAIVPLGDFRRSTFWDGMRGTEGRRQQERPVRPITIHMNVNTPDLPSFQASRQQIVSQLSVALRKAGRNV